MKKLTKKAMRENLNLTKDEINLVWEYQETFTQFWDNECEGFCVDARLLYSELGYDEEKNHFNRWIKNFIEILHKEESTDYERFFIQTPNAVKGSSYTQEEMKEMSKQKRTSLGISSTYNITLEFAKEICVTVGVLPRTNAKTKDLSSKVRKYFILMEKLVHSYEKWNIIRKDEKKGYNILKQSLEDNSKRKNTRITTTDYCDLANLMNSALFGFTSKEMRDWCGLDTSIRDNFSIEENKAIDECQVMLTGLLKTNMSKKQIIDNFNDFVINSGWNFKEKYDKLYDTYVKEHGGY
ncbi:antA/AntB antirepressor family protein [Clostridium botulinum]|uniref:antA/AntB antirepressor family protein n=1 Tax=Clostridium botulinum TaxID=1491 RepID=UPI001C9A6A3D|nr:antA/AntB antirepressor family protein [Clostridium botulinum]MBY6838813.1 antA/AntB antirepressor family protein [Clostridium botulinum]